MSNASETVPLGTTTQLESNTSSHFGANVEIVSRDRYVLGDEMAQGGIGRILRANDKRLERHVALKQLLDPNPENEARFLREALVTAKLQHPAIVPVYDVGRFPDGEIFYAMKLVTGRSLGEVVEEAGSFDERLALLPHVIAVAEAIAYAHSERIVHRDLKPANVLIGPFGETVVIDWGIAKDLNEQEALNEAMNTHEHAAATADGSTSLTMAGAVLGTPGYMPPEQAAGNAVDERADVYALGAILYHVLAGVAPYTGTNGFEILTQVLTQEPPDLSTRERRVPRDLLAIVEKAMARDAQDRYPTANEFAHDLRRFQTGQIVGAYHYSRRERLSRFVQRHRAVVGSVSLGLLLVGVIAFTSLARVLDARRMAETERDRANDERTRAEDKHSEAEAARRKALEHSDELILLEARTAARHDPNAAIGWLASLSESFHRWGEVRLIATDADEYGIAKLLRGHKGAISMIVYSPDGKLVATASDDRRVGLWSADGKLVRMLEGHTDEVWRVKFYHGSERLLSSSKDGTVRLWDVSTGQTLRTLHASGPETAWTEFLQDEDHLAMLNCSGRHVEIHNLSTGAIDVLPGKTQCPGSFAISADRRTITYSSEGHPRAIDLETRKFEDYAGGKGSCVTMYVTPNGRYIGCGGLNGYAAIWDTKTKKYTALSETDRNMLGFGLAQFSPAGDAFVWSQGNSVLMKDLTLGTIRTWTVHQGPLFAVFFARDGQHIVTTSFDHTTSFLDLNNGPPMQRFGFDDATSWADFSPDHQAVAVASWDWTARIFPLAPSRNRVISKGASEMKFARYSLDARSVVSLEENGTVHVDNLEERDAPGQTALLAGEAHALSLDGTLVAYAKKTGQIRIHKIGNQTRDEEYEGHTGPVRWIMVSPDNRFILTAGTDETTRLWERASGKGRIVLPQGSTIFGHNFSKNSEFAAVGDSLGRVHVFPTSGGSGHTFEGHVGDVDVIHFMPNGRQVVSGGKDHTIRIWDVEKGQQRTIEASGLGINQVLISPDAKTLFSLGTESSIRRWNLETGETLPILRGHRTQVVRIALSPEGSRLVSTGGNGDVRVWDLETGQSRLLQGHTKGASWVLFSPRGDQFITASLDGTVRVWYDDLPFGGPALRAWIANFVPHAGGKSPGVN